MADNGVLTPKQTAFLLGLMRFEKVEVAAKAAKVSCRTATRWQKLPAFQAALKQEQDAAFEKQLLILKQGMGAALTVLARNMSEKAPPAVQARCAIAWMEHSLLLHKIEGLERKLDELEEELAKGYRSYDE